MTIKRWIAACCALCFTLPVVAVEPIKKAASEKKAVTVPFELLKTGHMAVEVKVNGKGPYRLIFDTGAPINLLNNEVAKQTGLLKGKSRPLIPLFGSMGEVKIDTLEVGNQKIEDVEAVVMDHPTVEAMSNALGPIYGIVGFPFFARFEMTLDYQAKTMSLVPSGYKPPNVMRAMQAALMQGALGGTGKPKPTMLTPSAQWGMSVKKGDKEEEGVTVAKVLAGSAADKAGLKVGDHLLSIDGRWTDTVNDTYQASSFVKPGQAVKVKIKRDGSEMSLMVTPRSGF